jgi:hypothetical protein
VPVEVMRSGGGTFTAAVAAREPIHTLLSGPAAGAWGAAALGRALGIDELIGADVGGTSTDVTLIAGGRPATTADGRIDGLPFAVTTTDIHTIGAGGGSVAWRDAGGALRVGPRSAGAVPGPACYGRGGTEATVTDANVVLGRLDPDVRLGGQLPMQPDLARDAVGRLADDLGLDPMACAEGIVRVTDAQMVAADVRHHRDVTAIEPKPGAHDPTSRGLQHGVVAPGHQFCDHARVDPGEETAASVPSEVPEEFVAIALQKRDVPGDRAGKLAVDSMVCPYRIQIEHAYIKTAHLAHLTKERCLILDRVRSNHRQPKSGYRLDLRPRRAGVMVMISDRLHSARIPNRLLRSPFHRR